MTISNHLEAFGKTDIIYFHSKEMPQYFSGFVNLKSERLKGKKRRKIVFFPLVLNKSEKAMLRLSVTGRFWDCNSETFKDSIFLYITEDKILSNYIVIIVLISLFCNFILITSLQFKILQSQWKITKIYHRVSVDYNFSLITSTDFDQRTSW